MTEITALSRRLSVCALAVLIVGLTSSIPGRAELPPQYTTWADFGAVASQASIPNIIGVVERIERADSGRYIVRGGGCFVEVTVKREPPRGPNGEPMAGGSRIVDVKVGERRCG